MSHAPDDTTQPPEEHEAHGPPSVSPEWSRRILIAFGIGCVVLFLLDFVVHTHKEHAWEELPGFYALYGFIGVSGLIVASKELRKIVMRSEDYYDHE